MTLKIPSKLIYAGVFALTSILLPSHASADTLYAPQSVKTDLATHYAGNHLVQTFYGMEGRIKAVTFSAISSGGVGGTQFADTTYRMNQVRYCDNADMTVNCFTETFPNVDLTFNLSNACQDFTWNIPDGYLTPIPAGKYITFDAFRQTFTEVARACGNDNNPISYSDYGFATTSPDQPGFDLYIKVLTDKASETGVSPTVPITKNIEIFKPTYGTTTASTTFQVQVRYKTPFSLDFRPTTTRHFEIVDAVTGELDYSYDVILEANSGENLIINATTTTDSGSKFIRAMYLDQNGGIYSEVDEVFFNVATNTYYANTGLETPNSSPTGLTQIDCGTFEFGCQIQKALTFLFVPSNTVLDKFKNLWQTIAEKKPFGYVTMTISQLEALDSSGATAFDLGTIPFMDSIFTPFRDLIAGILWALFAIFFYQNRLKHLDI